MGIRERLQEIADELGSQKALADAAGVSKGRVTQWLKDKDILPTSIAAETALNIEKETGFRARWLVLNEGPRKVVGKSQHADNALPPHRLSRDGEQKLLVVLRSFLETDDEGKNQIVEAVKAVTGANGTGQPAKHHRTPKRRGGSSSN